MNENLFKCMLGAVPVLLSFSPTISVAADEKQPAKSKIPPALDKLVNAMKTAKTPKERFKAAARISKDFGPKALPALSMMLEVLADEMVTRHTDPQARGLWRLSGALGNSIVAIGPVAVPQLIKTAKTAKRPRVRAAALDMLARIGHKRGKELEDKIWPLLAKGLSDRSPLVRYYALQSINYYPNRIREVWPTVLKLVRDQTPVRPNGWAVGVRAADSVMGAAARGQHDLAMKGLPLVITGAGYNNERMVRSCIRAMGEVGRRIPDTRERIYRELISMFKKHKELRSVILGNLERINATSKKDLDLFHFYLKDRKHTSIKTQIALLDRFRIMGPTAAPVVADIVELLASTKETRVKRFAIRALTSIGVEHPRAFAVLSKLSKSDADYRVRSEAEGLLRYWQ